MIIDIYGKNHLSKARVDVLRKHSDKGSFYAFTRISEQDISSNTTTTTTSRQCEIKIPKICTNELFFDVKQNPENYTPCNTRKFILMETSIKEAFIYEFVIKGKN